MTLRCPACRTRRSTYAAMQAHIQQTGHRLCQCGGPAFTGGLAKHRPGSPCCIHHPDHPLDLARRYGATPDDLVDVLIEMSLDRMGRVTAECPF